MRRLVAGVIVAAAALMAGCSASFSIGDPSSSPTSGSMKKATASYVPEDDPENVPEETTRERGGGPELTVDRTDLAQRVSELLEEQVGRAPDSVTCPEDLVGEVGAETRCVLEDAGDRYGVDVVVTNVRGTNVGFDIKVDDQPS